MAKKVVICVDDEKIVLDSLKKEIINSIGNGFIIEVAESGEEALELYEELTSDKIEVCLIISDYIMPEMKGDELLRRVRQLNNDIYTIMLTGQATIQGVVNAINNAGLYRYMSKPWEANDLSLTIQEALKSYEKDIELEKRRIALEEANANLLKLESAKTYFLGLLSHELKTPLIGINGNAKMIAEVTDDPDIKECALDILSSEARLRKFADLSLLITRIQTDKYESTFYEEKISDIIDGLVFNVKDKLIEKNLTIIKEMDEVDLVFNMDVSLISKVFEMIMENAIKFSNSDSIIKLTLNLEKDRLVARIIDNGIGFSNSSIENTFKFFVSSDDLMSHSEGTGLSLAAAKVIMEFHHFDIEAKNGEKGGAIIELIFEK
ncbi:MAG: response regulator [Candidatus Kapabacteria bacterium]|nr:response regulator [Candidatus Kapabacteria bacterium]